MRPNDLPNAERFAHGTRSRYICGCRCVPCRAANSRYESERLIARAEGDWNGLVDAAPAREHLLKLSAAGIGRRTVERLSGAGDTVLVLVKNGSKTRIRARTERRILGVQLDGTFVEPPRVEWCKPCLERHGHRCAATHHAEKVPMCWPCFDGKARCDFGKGRGMHMKLSRYRTMTRKRSRAYWRSKKAAL